MMRDSAKRYDLEMSEMVKITFKRGAKNMGSVTTHDGSMGRTAYIYLHEKL